MCVIHQANLECFRLLIVSVYPASGLPQRLQKRAVGSVSGASQDGQVRPTRRFAPQTEQKAAPACPAAPQLPQRPGRGGT